MVRESKATKRERALEMCKRMDVLYPDALCELSHYNPFTLLISVMLSAQTTDAAVNKVTPELFNRWPDAYAMAQADVDEVAAVIRSIGFWRTKSNNAVRLSQMLIAEHNGEVPHTMAELTKLPGVGRKTANIVLNDAFDIVEGIAVDTHVFRIATRLKLTNKKTPKDAEGDLLNVIPQEKWKPVNHQLVLFGREWCDAKRPRCGECPLTDICPSAGKE